MQALVEALTSEKLGALEAQKQRMDAVVAGCEKAITLAEDVMSGDDWTLMTKREQVASQIGHALSKTCQLDADWSEKLQVGCAEIASEGGGASRSLRACPRAFGARESARERGGRGGWQCVCVGPQRERPQRKRKREREREREV